MNTLWFVDAKKRKLIVRALKPYVGKICMEEYGHLALCALFDTVDDTVLVTKQIIAPMLEELDQLCDDQYGRKVLLYLLVQRNLKYLVPQLAEVLAGGDGNTYSKKEAGVRQAELQKTVVPALVKHIAGNAADMVSVGAASHLVLETMQAVTDETAGVDECVAALAATAATGSIEAAEGSKKAVDPTESSSMGHNVAHRLMQRLLSDTSPVAAQLSKALYGEIKGSIGKWAECNRGAFVILALLKGPDAEVVVAVAAEVTAAEASLARVTGVGTTKLLEHLHGDSAAAAPKQSAGTKKKKSTKTKKSTKK
jgi:pumilio family protein 6